MRKVAGIYKEAGNQIIKDVLKEFGVNLGVQQAEELRDILHDAKVAMGAKGERFTDWDWGSIVFEFLKSKGLLDSKGGHWTNYLKGNLQNKSFLLGGEVPDQDQIKDIIETIVDDYNQQFKVEDTSSPSAPDTSKFMATSGGWARVRNKGEEYVLEIGTSFPKAKELIAELESSVPDMVVRERGQGSNYNTYIFLIKAQDLEGEPGYKVISADLKTKELTDVLLGEAEKEFGEAYRNAPLDERGGIPNFEEIMERKLGRIPVKGDALYEEYIEIKEEADLASEVAGDLEYAYRVNNSREEIGKLEDEYRNFSSRFASILQKKSEGEFSIGDKIIFEKTAPHMTNGKEEQKATIVDKETTAHGVSYKVKFGNKEWWLDEGVKLRKASLTKQSDGEETFGEYLKNHNLDCDLIIAGAETPASFVWDSGVIDFTEEGRKQFSEILDSPFKVLENGNIEVFSKDWKLGVLFVEAAAGLIGDQLYKRWFEEKDLDKESTNGDQPWNQTDSDVKLEVANMNVAKTEADEIKDLIKQSKKFNYGDLDKKPSWKLETSKDGKKQIVKVNSMDPAVLKIVENDGLRYKAGQNVFMATSENGAEPVAVVKYAGGNEYIVADATGYKRQVDKNLLFEGVE